jgi:serpin B
MDAVLHSAAGAGGGNGINSPGQMLAGLSGTFKDPGGTEHQLTLRIANAPFAQRGLQLEGPFLDTLASKYGAGLRLVDFQNDPDGACRLIDSWVSDQTEGRIPKLLDSLDSNVRLVLVNAIYLKAPWLEPFAESDTKTAPFTRPNGSQVSVPTMSLNLSEGRYASGTGWQAVELPYGGGSLAMTIVVPDDLAAFEHGLDAARFAQITTGLQAADVDLTLPRFKIETKSNLNSALAGMGMPLAFDPSRADFSGMTTQAQLYIERVVHQANIAVDEKGTEATAATAVVMAAASAAPIQQVTLHVDRPFIFAVRDTNTGAILFLGRVVDPSA